MLTEPEAKEFPEVPESLSPVKRALNVTEPPLTVVYAAPAAEDKTAFCAQRLVEEFNKASVQIPEK